MWFNHPFSSTKHPIYLLQDFLLTKTQQLLQFPCLKTNLMQEILQNLNREQLEAVLYNDGPLLLLAGAGTGKTRVLTSKIAYLIKNQMAMPSEILAVTFTNKASNEMKDRVTRMTNLDVGTMWISTFHSIAARILRIYGELIGLEKDFVIIDQDEQITLVKQIMKEFNIDTKEYSPKLYLESISKAKDSTKKVKQDLYLYLFDEVFISYQNKMKYMKMCDFSDLLLLNLKLFKERLDIKEYYNRKFKYILVDEYQDTNSIQHEWLKLISGVERNDLVKITCVGDDDQSIYGWRGAELKNILTFKSDYKKAKILKLERNYRSSKNILEVASNLIANNKDRHSKKLYSNNDENNEKVKVVVANDSKQEAVFVANEIGNLKQNLPGVSYKDIGILVRAGYQTRVFEDVFLKYAVPYRVIGGLKFYDRKEIKDCIAYLKFIANRSDSLSFERIINTPRRGVGAVTISKISNFAGENNLDYITTIENLCTNQLIKGKTKEELLIFVKNVKEWIVEAKTVSLKNIMQIILVDTGYREFIAKDKDLESKTKLENVEELLNTLSDFSSIDEFLEYIALVSDNNDMAEFDSVSIMTIHSAKGLEFDTVFLPNWQEGVFPSPKSLDEKSTVEEERRLAYVALTRAKNRLYISYSKYKYEYGEISAVNPSRFIGELPEKNVEVLDISSDNYYYDNYYKFRNNYKNSYISTKDDAGRKINSSSGLVKKCLHKKFGIGYIKKEDGDKLTIIFEKAGEKVIMKSFVDIL